MEKKNQQESEKQKISKIEWLYQKNIFANYINYCIKWMIMITIAVTLGFVVRIFTQNYGIILGATFVTFMFLSIILRKTFKKMDSIGFKVQEAYFRLIDKSILRNSKI